MRYLLALTFAILPLTAVASYTPDINADMQIDLSELLRVIQYYNSTGLHCEPGSEDGYAPGLGADCVEVVEGEGEFVPEGSIEGEGESAADGEVVEGQVEGIFEGESIEGETIPEGELEVCDCSLLVPVEGHPIPNVKFEFIKEYWIQGAIETAVYVFIDKSDIKDSVSFQETWDFGDGSTFINTKNSNYTFHIYEQQSIYFVKMILKTDHYTCYSSDFINMLK